MMQQGVAVRIPITFSYRSQEGISGWRRLKIFDDLGLDTRIADHGQRVAGSAALRVMVEGDFAHAAAFPVNDGLPQRHAQQHVIQLLHETGGIR